jgi:hypothetical protein
MKYIKNYEGLIVYDHKTTIDDILNDELNVYVKYDAYIGAYMQKSKYDIDIVEYFKEIFIGKYIDFRSINRIKGDPRLEGVVLDVDQFSYQDEFYIKVKLSDDWHIIKSDSGLRIGIGGSGVPGDNNIFIKDYDADSKPLHKEVKLKKNAEIYNL